jgi:hypothetical protein
VVPFAVVPGGVVPVGLVPPGGTVPLAEVPFGVVPVGAVPPAPPCVDVAATVAAVLGPGFGLGLWTLRFFRALRLPLCSGTAG